MSKTETAPETALPQAAEAPSYVSDPAGYLIHHNWRPIGDPALPLTTWLEPGRPIVRETYGRQIVLAPTLTRELETLTDPVSGKTYQQPKVRLLPVCDPQSGKPVFQTVITHPGMRLARDAAVGEQVARDMAALELAEDEADEQGAALKRQREEALAYAMTHEAALQAQELFMMARKG